MTRSHTVQLLLKRGHTIRAIAHNKDERSMRLQEIGAAVVIETRDSRQPYANLCN